MFEQFSRQMREGFERSLARLTHILDEVMAGRQKEVAAAVQARHQLKETAAHYWRGAGRTETGSLP